MFKKLLLITFLLVTFFGLCPLNQPVVLAQDEGVESEYFMFDLGKITHKDIKEQSWIRKGVNYLFERAITIMAATVGSVAVLAMSIGGFLMLTSAGRQEQYDKGKSLILKAVIGLVFVFGAYILVTAIQLLIKGIFSK